MSSAPVSAPTNNMPDGIPSDNPYCSTEEILRLREKQIVRKSIKRISEKYDSVENFGPLTENNVKEKGDGVSGRPHISEPNSISPTHSYGRSTYAEGITDQDILQAEMFFKSHKTDVHVCQCLANLYFGKVMDNKDQWKFAMTGIPVLVLDTGDHHRKRKLQIVLAEKGTGFILWKDEIDHLTMYKAPHMNFHTLHISTDHTRLAGFSFDETAAASEFYNTILKLTSDPDDDLLKLSKSKKRSKSEKKKNKTKYKPPKKTEISTPCCFVHVTKLEREPLELTSSIDNLQQESQIQDTNSLSPSRNDGEGSDVSSLVGSKLTINSEDTSSGISEDRLSSDQ